MTLNEFIKAGWAKIKQIEAAIVDVEPPKYKPGTPVITKSGGYGYISKVIGSNRRGFVETEEQIPLVRFPVGEETREETYYVNQKHLIECEN